VGGAYNGTATNSRSGRNGAYPWCAAVSPIGKRRSALIAVVLAAATLTACASETRAGTPSTHEAGVAVVPVIPCSEVGGTDKSGTEADYRVVLGVISVPPARLRKVVPTKSRPWPFWRKAGLFIHPSHKTVTVSVPRAWRRRFAIVWGSARPPVSALKFQACPNLARQFGYAHGVRWNGYPGGFYLRKRRECVPLTFKVGNRSHSVRFGFNIPCSGR